MPLKSHARPSLGITSRRRAATRGTFVVIPNPPRAHLLLRGPRGPRGVRGLRLLRLLRQSIGSAAESTLVSPLLQQSGTMESVIYYLPESSRESSQSENYVSSFPRRKQ